MYRQNMRQIVTTARRDEQKGQQERLAPSEFSDYARNAKSNTFTISNIYHVTIFIPDRGGCKNHRFTAESGPG